MQMRTPTQFQRPFFYGWVIVTAAFLIQLVAFSLSDSFGVFVDPWVNDFGWTRASISGAYSTSFVMMGLMGIVMGVLTDKYGPRTTLSLCAIGLGTGYWLVSRMQAPWQLYLGYGILFGTGMGAVWAPLLSLISRWFIGKRSLAIGIVISGGGLGAFIGPAVISKLIEALTWSKAVLILGGFAFLVIIVTAQFLKRDPSQRGQTPYPAEKEQTRQFPTGQDFSFKEALATTQFWTIFVLLFCLAFYTFSILVHIIPHSVQLGISGTQAAYILGSISGASIAGNYVMGRFGDRIGPRKVLMISFLLMSAALFWLAWAGQLWGLYLFSIVFGFNHGGNATAQAPLVARVFGLKAHGTIFGAAAFGFTIGGAAGPLVTGYIFDRNGSYVPAFILAGIVGMAGLALITSLRPTKRMPIQI
jgi:MFS family permease